MKQITTYIGYIMGLAGFASLVWTYATASAGKKYDVADLKKDVVRIETNMATKNDFDALHMMLFNYSDQSRITDSAIIENYNSFRKSWILYVKNHTKDYDSLLKYFQGIEFQLDIPNYPGAKIKIEKIEKEREYKNGNPNK